MDLEPALKRSIERVWEALVAYAKRKRWSDDDYLIFMTVNKDWGRINVEFLTKSFGDYMKPVSFEAYDELMDYLDKELADDPALNKSLDVHLAGLGHYSDYLRRGPSEEFVDATDLGPPKNGSYNAPNGT